LLAATAQQATQSEEKTFARIEALVGSKSYEEAEDALQSAIAHGTPPARAYLRMGKILLDHDEWQRAANFLERSLQDQPGNDQAHLFLGLTYRQLKQPERAEQEFIKAAELNPRSDVNAYFAGHQLLIDMRFEAALPYLYNAVKLNPRSAAAYRALGMTQVHLGNYGLAESYYRKAVDIIAESGSTEPEPFLDLAFILLLGHDPAKVQEALTLAQRAAKLQHNSSEAHYLVGKALMKMGRAREAVPELEWAATLNPTDSKAHFQLARAYDDLGEKEKARVERQALAKTKQAGNQQGMASGSVMPETVQ
jgi:tetratricopeptide (TPR) repeat protein